MQTHILDGINLITNKKRCEFMGKIMMVCGGCVKEPWLEQHLLRMDTNMLERKRMENRAILV